MPILEVSDGSGNLHPFAVANPISVEQEKPAHDKGYYRHPEVYSLPRERAIRVLRNPYTEASPGFED